jgi:hypothetical protein
MSLLNPCALLETKNFSEDGSIGFGIMFTEEPYVCFQVKKGVRSIFITQDDLESMFSSKKIILSLTERFSIQRAVLCFKSMKIFFKQKKSGRYIVKLLSTENRYLRTALALPNRSIILKPDEMVNLLKKQRTVENVSVKYCKLVDYLKDEIELHCSHMNILNLNAPDDMARTIRLYFEGRAPINVVNLSNKLYAEFKLMYFQLMPYIIHRCVVKSEDSENEDEPQLQICE